MKKILFICTGNYYRSRFAEIYFNEISDKRKMDWLAFSRGLDISNLNNTGAISIHVLIKLQELKISLPSELVFPKILTKTDLSLAKKIIVMNGQEHRPIIKKFFPTWINKIVFWNIYDLYEEGASSSLMKLKFKLDEVIDELQKGTVQNFV